MSTKNKKRRACFRGHKTEHSHIQGKTSTQGEHREPLTKAAWRRGSHLGLDGIGVHWQGLGDRDWFELLAD